MYINDFNISLPFVFLDSSYVIRATPSIVRKLNRGLLWQNPIRFHSLLHKVINASEKDDQYYNNLIKLQKVGIISHIITMDAINTYFIHNPDVLVLFYKSMSSMDSDLSTSNLILWGESIDSTLYSQAKQIIQNASSLIIDQTFLQIQVGKRLVEYAPDHCMKAIIGNSTSTRYEGDTYTFFNVSPQSFIQNLALSI